MGANITDHSELNESYGRFVEQLSGWYSGGELPQLASQDMRYILQLQRQKLNSLGLDMQCELKKTSIDKADVGSITFSDRVFTNNIVGGNINMTRSIGSSQSNVYMDTQEIGLTAVIQDLKKDTQPSSNMPLSCPHCGAASTLVELESGCKYCGTKFVMSELYPKVSNFFILRHEDKAEKSKTNKREMAAYSTDPTQLACCNCQCTEETADIIEADIFNLNVNNCEINGDVCDVETTLFLDCLHYTNGRIVYTPNKFHTSVRKRLKKPTELGFSFSAVSCPSCGASFDAHNVKACPYCHTQYNHEENDWVITGLWK